MAGGEEQWEPCKLSPPDMWKRPRSSTQQRLRWMPGSGSALTPARLHSAHVTDVAASCLNPSDQQEEEEKQVEEKGGNEEEVPALCAN